MRLGVSSAMSGHYGSGLDVLNTLSFYILYASKTPCALSKPEQFVEILVTVYVKQFKTADHFIIWRKHSKKEIAFHKTHINDQEFSQSL